MEDSSPVVVVIGGGPAGLSAAIEAGPGQVRLLERDRSLGGSARYAAGITVVAGEGIDTLPERYSERVRPEVIEWTASLGQPWQPAKNPRDDGLQLVAPVGGGQSLASVLEAGARRAGVTVQTGAQVDGLTRGERWSVMLAGGEALQADVVIVATGGFAGQLEQVRAARPEVGPLLRGVPASSDGQGLQMVVAAGGAKALPASVLLYGHGVPHPEAPDSALMILAAPGGMWLQADGAPLSARHARGEGANFGAGQGGWLVLDRAGLDGLMLADPLSSEPVNAVQVVARSGWGVLSTAELAARTGVDVARFAERGCPCAALPLHATTSKSLSGVVTNAHGQVLDTAGEVIPGLFAAGEVAGFGGGRHPGIDSTMIAGAILSGRTAGRAARGTR